MLPPAILSPVNHNSSDLLVVVNWWQLYRSADWLPYTIIEIQAFDEFRICSGYSAPLRVITFIISRVVHHILLDVIPLILRQDIFHLLFQVRKVHINYFLITHSHSSPVADVFGRSLRQNCFVVFHKKYSLIFSRKFSIFKQTSFLF